MPYVVRNENGEITGVLQDNGTWVEDDDPHLIAYLKQQGADHIVRAKAALSASDSELARVVEDLIGVLIEKELIMFTELPEAAQHKLADRANLRVNLGGSGGLMVGEDEIL